MNPYIKHQLGAATMTTSNEEPIFTLSGSVTRDLSWAALGGMSSAFFSYADQLIPAAGIVTIWLIVAGRFMLWWGLLRVGRIYKLRWTARGAKLLLGAGLSSLLAAFSMGSVHSFANWLVGPLLAIGIVVAFVDLWALRQVINRVLVTCVIIGFVGLRFMRAAEWLSAGWLDFLDIVNVGLIAWLYYIIIDQLSADRATLPDGPDKATLTV